MKTQQQWKFKTQTIPTALSIEGGPSFRRKRRHSEPHLQVEATKTYKSYVTHWKLPTTITSTVTSSSKITDKHTPHENLETSDTSNQPTLHEQDITQSPPRKVLRPHPLSPTTTQSPMITITPPANSASPDASHHQHHHNQQWKPATSDSLKSMFHPYKRDPLSPATNNTLTPKWDKRRNSAPHISYYTTPSSPTPSRDNRLETIPELSFPSHHSSPPRLSPRSAPSSPNKPEVFSSIGFTSHKPSSSTSHSSPLSPRSNPPFEHLPLPQRQQKQPPLGNDFLLPSVPDTKQLFNTQEEPPLLPYPTQHEQIQLPSIYALIQINENNYYDLQSNGDEPTGTSPSSITADNTITTSTYNNNRNGISSYGGNPDSHDMPKFARNTRRRMSVDNLLG